MPLSPRFPASFASIFSEYDGFIVDLWGVIHDGQRLYPGVMRTLELLHQREKKVVFLSNAPYRRQRVAGLLESLGVTQLYYHAIVTSGETAWEYLASPEKHALSLQGSNCYLLYQFHENSGFLNGLPYHLTRRIEEAGFLLLLDYYESIQPWSEVVRILEAAQRRNLPLICVNPDKKVVTLAQEAIACSGVVAEYYAQNGGEVLYFGKPYPAVYEKALEQLPGIDYSHILAVGDGLETDIRGANGQGLASVLVTGGIMQRHTGLSEDADYEARCMALFEREQNAPSFVLGTFGV